MSTIGQFIEAHQGELAFAGGILTFGWGVMQYVRAQRWQSAEFALRELSQFSETQHAQIVFKLLDFNRSTLEFEYEGENYELRMDDQRLMWMLRPHTIDGNLTAEEAALRAVFDRFFLDLEKFEYLVSIKLIRREALRPYLFYWLDLLGNKKSQRKSPELVQAFYNYLHFYKTTGVIRMLRRFGFWGFYDKNLRYTAPSENPV